VGNQRGAEQPGRDQHRDVALLGRDGGGDGLRFDLRDQVQPGAGFLQRQGSLVGGAQVIFFRDRHVLEAEGLPFGAGHRRRWDNVLTAAGIQRGQVGQDRHMHFLDRAGRFVIHYNHRLGIQPGLRLHRPDQCFIAGVLPDQRLAGNQGNNSISDLQFLGFLANGLLNASEQDFVIGQWNQAVFVANDQAAQRPGVDFVHRFLGGLPIGFLAPEDNYLAESLVVGFGEAEAAQVSVPAGQVAGDFLIHAGFRDDVGQHTVFAQQRRGRMQETPFQPFASTGGSFAIIRRVQKAEGEGSIGQNGILEPGRQDAVEQSLGLFGAAVAEFDAVGRDPAQAMRQVRQCFTLPATRVKGAHQVGGWQLQPGQDQGKLGVRGRVIPEFGLCFDTHKCLRKMMQNGDTRHGERAVFARLHRQCPTGGQRVPPVGE